MELLLIAAIAFVVSLISGMLGLGGAIMLIPLYLYLPGFFGLPALDVKSISGLTSVQVLATSLFGMIFHRKRGAVNRRLVLVMGIPIVAASLSGALLSKTVQPNSILTVFAVMAITGAVFVLLKKESADQELPQELSFNTAGAVIIAAAVGFFGGMVGAPGAFLLSPLMMTVLRIPTRITIGSTLGIVLLSAAAASAGKIAASLVPYVPTLVAVVSSVPGVYLGSTFSHRLPTRILRLALAVIIAGVGIQMMYRALAS
jgi:uncharacterized membrane protein YfcA